jgi:S1-C subfamily serine protease/Tfp pilus assembly protein PilF
VSNYWSVNGYNESTARQYFDNSPIDPIEGIWQSNDGFKLAVEKDVENNYRSERKYRVIILSHNVGSTFWKPTHVKGFIEKTAVNGVFNMDYYTAGYNNEISVQTCLGILESDVLFSFTRNDNGEKIIWVKLYPESKKGSNSNLIPDNSEAASGTGFAISSNGYIVTNHHVINGAKKIEIRGVNQNYNQSYSAEVVISDERNDLAIIRINDPLFSSLGIIPYALRNNLADVGENVFVLGYPLTTTMGTEVKLTNGIISSKTGFQGDISTYQISAPVQPGNSGGPLFDNSGNLIGIVNAKHGMAENAGYAIKVSYLKNLIELINNPPNLPSVNTISSKTLPEKVKVLSNFVYVVLVNDFSGTGSSNISGSNQTYDQNSSKNSQFYYNQASAKYQNKDFDGAYTDITKSIEADPNNTGAYYFRGYLNFFTKRNYEYAINDLTKVIQMKYDNAASYFLRGWSFAIIDKNADALKDYAQCLKYDEKNTDALFYRSILKVELGDYQGAINDCELILKFFSERPLSFGNDLSDVYNEIGWSYYLSKNYTKCIEYSNKAIKENPKHYNAIDTRGCGYFELGEYEKCITDMTKAIEINNESANSYLFRGRAYIKIGKRDLGCKDLSKAGELGKAEAYDEIKLNCK